jgi:hypothetical protein
MPKLKLGFLPCSSATGVSPWVSTLYIITSLNGQGGRNNPTNLYPACPACPVGKNDRIRVGLNDRTGVKCGTYLTGAPAQFPSAAGGLFTPWNVLNYSTGELSQFHQETGKTKNPSDPVARSIPQG